MKTTIGKSLPHYYIVGWLASLMMLSPVQAEEQIPLQITESSAGGGWVDRHASIVIGFQRSYGEDDGLRFFVGNRELTPLFKAFGPQRMVYDGKDLELPSGENPLRVYQVIDGQWSLLYEETLRVLSRGGFEVAELSSNLNVNVNSLVDEDVEGNGFPSGDEGRQDLDAHFGWNSRHLKGEWELQSRGTFIGVSRREQALRFQEKGTNASKVDLSDYHVQLRRGRHQLSLGHVQYGQHRLLASNIANRGLNVTSQLTSQIDVAMSVQSGSSITGYDHLLGMNNSDHRISALRVGSDLIQGASGHLRMEVSYLDASILPQAGFDVGQVVDAETSHGFGLRLLGSAFRGRLQGEILTANSRFDNPQDNFLSFGADTVEVDRESANAVYGEASVILVDNAFSGSSSPVNVVLRLVHENNDPLYRSVGAYVTPDIRQTSTSMDIRIGSVGLQLQSQNSEDNLDNLESILKTKTKTYSGNASIPFNQWWGFWFPAFNHSYNRVHQYGDNQPLGFDDPSQIPDQVSTSNGTGLSWYFSRFGINYSYNNSLQDNRQLGRERADFEQRQHSLNLSLQALSNLSVGLDLGRDWQFNREIDQRNYGRRYGVNLDWRISSTFGYRGSYNYNRNFDSEGASTSTNFSVNSQIYWRFSVPSFGGYRLPGELFMGYALNDFESQDNVFGFNAFSRTTTLHVGFTMSLF